MKTYSVICHNPHNYFHDSVLVTVTKLVQDYILLQKCTKRSKVFYQSPIHIPSIIHFQMYASTENRKKYIIGNEICGEKRNPKRIKHQT